MLSPITFPLFHGTSSVFISSIQAAGLGGYDPIAGLRAFECLKLLCARSSELLRDDKWWLVEHDSIERMCHQSISGGGFNFRHGQTYLSASEETAVRYACSNAFGSELLSTCINLSTRLRCSSPQAARQIEGEFPEVFSLRAAQAKPVLIRAKGVLAGNLLSETGASAEHTISLVRQRLAEKTDGMLQALNFTTSSPIPFEQLEFYSVQVENTDQISPKYKLARLA